MSFQRTLGGRVQIEGVGLHSGQEVRVDFLPAPAFSGIHLIRRDLLGSPSFKLSPERVMATDMATTLGMNKKTSISTVEHALSAVAALGIDNLRIEIDGPEMPILDGSAQVFFKKLHDVGFYEYKEPKYFFRINKTVLVGNSERYARIFPYGGLKVSNTINFDHPCIGEQHIEFELSARSFEEQIMSARTFGFLKDAEYLQSKGLALGGSLDNAIVLDQEKVVNSEGLRYKDEFVRHKVLDAIGDMMTLGHPLLGHLVLYKAGHRLMNQLMRTVLLQKDSYSICQLTENTYDREYSQGLSLHL